MILPFLWACQGLPSGASESLRVREGTFMEGELPFDDTATTPSIIYAASRSYIATQGQGNLGYNGLATPDAYSVAVWFPGVSSGYWVVPVGGPDVTQDNDLLFDFTVDFGDDVPYGLGEIEFVAIDGSLNAGPKYGATICILPDYSDNNYTACSNDIPPQHTILSLRWDTPVDLDLVVTAPDGKLITPKTPTTAIDGDGDGKVDIDANTGFLSRDSNSNCNIDNFDLESLVFAEQPAAGDYGVYASLWSPCGQRYVNYSATLYQRVDNNDGTWSITQTELPYGEIQALSADAGATLGTYITTLTIPEAL